MSPFEIRMAAKVFTHDGCVEVMLEAADEIDRLRAGIQRLLEEGAPRAVANPYADDGKPHKGDQCPHGCSTWQSCDACTDEYLARLLAPDKEG